MDVPQNRRFYGKMKCLPLWPNYRGEKGKTLGKTYGIKARCYWEHRWGTHWKLEREHVRNKGKMNKNLPSIPTPQKLKRKIKSMHFECKLSLSIGCMKFLCCKTIQREQ
jgi:hypothetical protein